MQPGANVIKLFFLIRNLRMDQISSRLCKAIKPSLMFASLAGATRLDHRVDSLHYLKDTACQGKTQTYSAHL